MIGILETILIAAGLVILVVVVPFIVAVGIALVLAPLAYLGMYIGLVLGIFD